MYQVEEMSDDGSATNCVACGLRAGYNRAVVDTVGDGRVGGLCVRCEEAEFGRSLARCDWGGEGCAFCERDGFYALPAWRPYSEDRGGKTVCKVGYRVDAATVRFCDEHFDRLRDSRPRAAEVRERGDGRLP